MLGVCDGARGSSANVYALAHAVFQLAGDDDIPLGRLFVIVGLVCIGSVGDVEERLREVVWRGVGVLVRVQTRLPSVRKGRVADG